MGERRAVHIGLSRIREPDGVRHGPDGPMRLGAVNGDHDARRLANMTSADRFDNIALFVDHVATRDAVLTTVSTPMPPGSLLFVTYAGHGFRARDRDGEEEDGFDETWELFDGSLLDDDIGAALASHAQSTWIVLISDSCHSSSVALLQADERPKRLGATPPSPVSPLPVYELNGLGASLLSISACTDDQNAYEHLGWGVLTNALLAGRDEVPGPASWWEWASNAAARVRSSYSGQTPTLRVTASGMDLLSAAPLHPPTAT